MTDVPLPIRRDPYTLLSSRLHRMISISELLLGKSEETPHGRHASGNNAGSALKPTVTWALTRASDLHCIYCYTAATASPQANELSFDEGKALLDDLKAFDVPGIVFGGGEPLVRPDALDLMHYAHHIGLRCSLSTNGQLLTDRVADRLATMGLEHVAITIDGAPERHDRLTGKEGAFDAAIQAIRRCRARHIRVGIGLTVHGLNYQDVPEIFRICREEDVEQLCVYHLVRPETEADESRLRLSPEQTRLVVEQIIALTFTAHLGGYPLEVSTVGNHSDAGYVLLHLENADPRRADIAANKLLGTGGNRSGCNIAMIDSSGDVHYDNFSSHYSLGNVRRTPFSQIWADAKDERLLILRDRVPHLSQRCQKCRFIDICNGNIRSRAEALTGDWLAPDPGCYLHDDERA